MAFQAMHEICTTSCAPHLRSSLWNRHRPPAHKPVSACCGRLASVCWTPGDAGLEALPYTAHCCAAHPCFSTLLFERASNERATELLLEVACAEDLKLNRDSCGPSLLPDDPHSYIQHFLRSQRRLRAKTKVGHKAVRNQDSLCDCKQQNCSGQACRCVSNGASTSKAKHNVVCRAARRIVL